MAKEHGKSGRNQPKNQPNMARQNTRHRPDRKKSQDQRPKQPIKRTIPVVPTRESREPEKFDDPSFNNKAATQRQLVSDAATKQLSISKPPYKSELNIKIPANLKKKNPSIDLPDLKSLRRERAQRVMQAMKSLEEVLDQFEYPQDPLPNSTIKELVMQIESFQKN